MILVIEDDALTARALVRVFGEGGTMAVEDFETGVTQAARYQPDVIIMDALLDEQDAIDGIPRLLRVSPDSKIIVLSLRVDRFSRNRALACGAAAYVHKMQIDQIDEVVEDILSSVAASVRHGLH
jgi:DNA-binding NarL/FixJ family response regulator